METTVTVLAEIAAAMRPGLLDWAIGLGQLTAVAISVAAVLVAMRALRGEQASRSAQALADLFAYFESKALFVRMWRLEQASRSEGATAIGRTDISTLLRHQQPLVSKLAREAFASDWDVERADMFAIYFFAVRTHAWLSSSRDGTLDERVRLLNGYFGHQLFSTLLSHRIVACRLFKQGLPIGYYPTYYGLFDPAYSDLFDRLAADVLRDGYLPTEVADPMRARVSALRAYLPTIAPITDVVDLPSDGSS